MAAKDLLDNIAEELLKPKDRIIVQQQYGLALSNSVKAPGATPSKTPGPAQDVDGFVDLVRRAVEHAETIGKVIGSRKVMFTRDYSLKNFDKDIVTHSIAKRQPGSVSQASPFEGVKNYRPILREEVEDSSNPGYKSIVFGFIYDNIVRFTCFSRTNKEADERALWFEKLINSYLWFFRYSGVNRVLYYGRGQEVIESFEGNNIYGREIDFFVRTEEISIVSEKTIEQIVVNYDISI